MMRTEIGAATVASVIANVNRDPDKTEAFTLSDFSPHLQKQAISLEEAMKQWG